MRLKGMIGGLLVLPLAATAFTGLAFAGTAGTTAASAAAGDELLYRLEMNDASEMFANTAGTEYAAATAPEGNSFTVETVGGRTGLNFVGGTKMQNYLSLPTQMFAETSAVTVSGWFYLPEQTEAYLCEVGIGSQTENAALRADPYANFHGDAYLFVAGDIVDVGGGRGSGVKPVYNAWYHMAYVLDSQAHTFTVYQNGAEVLTQPMAEDFSTSEFAASDAVFYLGQASYEDSHSDYKGMMSDVRVYGAALTAQELKSEYNLQFGDFQTAEYTFDNAEDRLEDSVRGYDMEALNENPIDFTSDVMTLKGGAAAVAFRSGLHENYFAGHSSVTISMELNIATPNTTNWKRIMNMLSTSSRITFMSSCPRTPGNVFDAVYNDGVGAENNMIGDNSFALPENEWFNLTITMSGTTIKAYYNGQLMVTGTSGDKPDFATFFYDYANSAKNGGGGNFTFGTNTDEQNGLQNYLEASYDNIRIWAAAATDAEVAQIATLNKATVTYDANGGVGDQIVTTVSTGDEVLVAQNSFTRDGFEFAGWNTEADGSGTDYAAGASLTVNDDVVLYAQWDIAADFIHYQANGGRGFMADQAVPYEETGEIAECGFSRTGYTFTGWNTAADGSGTPYAAGAVVDLDGDLTLYALWQAKSYAVTFDANGGEGSMEKQQLVYDTPAALSANAFTRSGYEFAGWAYTAEGTAVFADGETVTGIAEGNDITLYAVWRAATVTIAFDANGGEGTMSALKGEALTFATLPANTFTKENATFLGWALQADGEVVYADGARIPLESDLTLYAVWQDGAPTEPSDPAEPSEPADPGEPSGGDNWWIGVVVAAVVVVAAGAVVAVVLIRKRKK